MNLDKHVAYYQAKIDAGMSLKDAVADFKKKLILEAHWNSASKSEAARMLGMNRPSMIMMCGHFDLNDQCDDIIEHNLRQHRPLASLRRPLLCSLRTFSI